MATYYTQGLPDGTHKENRYQFIITQNNVANENIPSYSIFIPGDYVGRDQIGEPTYPEQAKWLNSLTGYNLRESWYGTWEITGDDNFSRLVTLLNSCK